MTVHAVGVSVQSFSMTIDAVNSVRDGIPCTDKRTLKSPNEINTYDSSAGLLDN